ncbi:uncharacterized protein LOC120636499 [Pararge aegeria]|uniref:Jg21598 protein n=1 Tax=Pararge aegeria aegeria TaxID=348720 RepID=A0A8S4QJI8_9NEOP|nr:uncharacterized protein LOC120636499 [Pararge aegeria]CAH2215460.1 jg21598 [Pararge aegeria aegeria]
MICQRCQKSLRSCEGIKCGKCDSGFHLQCVSARTNMELDSGDKAFHWVCATCRNPVSGTKLELDDPRALLKAINAITEKFELVNKIQLPKLNNDLLQIKTVTERIVKQNEDILLKIEELKGKKRGDQSQCSPRSNYRRRNVNFSPRVTCEEQAPILGTEKFVRYRTRRRAYPLLKMLLQLNRKLRRGRTPRRQ